MRAASDRLGPPPQVPFPAAGRSRCLALSPFPVQGGPVEILPFLYLGSAYHAARRDMLDALGITALLNVSDCPNHFEGLYQYKCIPVEDNHKADISSWFMEAIEYIGRLAAAGVGREVERGPATGTQGHRAQGTHGPSPLEEGLPSGCCVGQA